MQPDGEFESSSHCPDVYQVNKLYFESNNMQSYSVESMAVNPYFLFTSQ